MKQRFFVYYRLQLKRCIRLLPTILVISLLLGLCLALLGAGFLSKNDENEANQLVTVGVTGSFNEPTFRIGMMAVQTMDSSRYSVQFVTMEEDEAERELLAGRLKAYVNVPDDFISSLLTDHVQPITYVTTDGAVGIGSMLINEIADAVARLLLESDNAVYGAQRVIHDYLPEYPSWSKAYELGDVYLDVALHRDRIFEVKTVGVVNSLSLIGYYVCAILVLFLLLWGIACSPVFTRRDRGLDRVLAARGFRPWVQVAAEYLACMLIMAAVLVLLGIVAAFLPVLGFEVEELTELGSFGAVRLVLRAIPVALCLSAMQFFLYEVASGAVNSILLQFVAAASLGYVSGCFYPITFFPVSVQHLASVLPTGIGIQYLGDLLRGSSSRLALVWLLLWTVAWLGLATLVRCRHLNRTGN